METYHPLLDQYQYLAYAMNGALWLDEVKPGWAEQIDVENLTMFDPNMCIAGQLFRDKAKELEYFSGYNYVIDTFGSSFAVYHGLVSPRSLWINLINKRLDA